VPIDRDDQDERIARIDLLLEELRLNNEDLVELARQARERSRVTRAETRALTSNVRRERAAKKRARKKR